MRAKKNLVLSKRAEMTSQDSGFDSGVVVGAAIGVVGALAAVFVIKGCTDKPGVSDDFNRI